MRLLIAERSPVLRKRLTRLFSDLGYFSLFALAEELSAVQEIALEVKPDVIVMDIDFPNDTNLKILAELRDKIKNPKLLVLTESIEPRYTKQFHNSGVDMVFNKKDDLNKFIEHLNLLDDMIKKPSLV